MRIADLLELPTTVDLAVANAALGIGSTLGYAAAKAGDYPVPVLRVGGRYRVPTCHLVDALGLRAVADAVEAERRAS